MAFIGWLHLSDLHQGLKDQDWLWPSVKERFFADLERMHRRAGPWDLVLFTGDLTQRGTREEFDRLTETLEAIWRHLERLGSPHPLLVAVPGNHDLVRPDPKRLAVKALRNWHGDRDIGDQLLTDPASEVRQLIDDAFAPFMAWQRAWLQAHPPRPGVLVQTGLLPGDVSVLLDDGGLRLGVVGLNSAFLQLEAVDYERRLDLDPRQLHAVCAGDPAVWVDPTHATLLLTHHPPEWLHLDAQDRFRELIAPPGRFVAHLYGHMHEPTARFSRVAGASAQRELQAASLFGLETWGDGRAARIHGYSAGRIDVNGRQGKLRIWPRILHKTRAGDRRMVADPDYTLDEDEAFGDRFEVRAPAGAAAGVHAARGAVPPADARAAAVARYRKLIAADRGQGLLSWEDLDGGREATGERDLLRIFVVPELTEERPSSELALETDAAPETAPAGPPAPLHTRAALPPEPADAILFDEARPWALVLGGPGSGKSALAAWLQLRLCVPGEAPAGPAGDMVPIRIALRHLEQRRRQAGARPYDVFEHLEAELGPGGLRADEIRALAEAGRITWIFDGLDEVVEAEARAWHARMIGDLKHRYGGRGLITSRLAGCERTRPLLEAQGVQTFRLLDFDDNHVDAWIKRWHARLAQRSPEAAARRRDRLERALRESPAVRELCRTPLLLTLVAGLSRHADLPERRSEVYARVVSHLVDDWEAKKRLGPEGPGFDFEDKDRFLRRLAWRMMDELPGGSGNVVAERDLERFAVQFCQDELDQAHAVALRTARALIERLRDRHGVLVFHGDESYGFAHRALLDYLAAQEVAERVRREGWRGKQLGALLAKRWSQREWRELIALLLGQVAERQPHLVLSALQHFLRPLPLSEEWYTLSWAADAIQSLSEVERLDRDPLRSFAIQITELIRNSFIISDLDDKFVSVLRGIGERWPGSSILRSWALETKEQHTNGLARGHVCQMAIATAPFQDRQALLMQLLATETSSWNFTLTLLEALRHISWNPEDIIAIITIAARAGEETELEAGKLLYLHGSEFLLDRLLGLMRSASQPKTRLEAAQFLAKLAIRWRNNAPWSDEAVERVLSGVESHAEFDRRSVIDVFSMDMAHNETANRRLRKWIRSPDERLQDIAVSALVATGDPEATDMLEQRVRDAGMPDPSRFWYHRLTYAARIAEPARQAVARILADRKITQLHILLSLAGWWSEFVRPDEALAALLAVSHRVVNERERYQVARKLILIPGGDDAARLILGELASSSSSRSIRVDAASLLVNAPGPLDLKVKSSLRELASEGSEPESQSQAAHILAISSDLDLRRDGLRALGALARSSAPERIRWGAAISLHRSGDPTGTEVLTELAEQATSPEVRLDAARDLQDAATLRLLAHSADDPQIRSRAERLLALLEARRRLLQVGRLRRGIVSLSGERVGLIEELSGGGTRFAYDPAWVDRPGALPVGPSMPLRHAAYPDEGLLPFFENLLPEGWLLDITRRKLGVAPNDPFGLLLATCGDCIGAVEITPAPDEEDAA